MLEDRLDGFRAGFRMSFEWPTYLVPRERWPRYDVERVDSLRERANGLPYHLGLTTGVAAHMASIYLLISTARDAMLQ